MKAISLVVALLCLSVAGASYAAPDAAPTPVAAPTKATPVAPAKMLTKVETKAAVKPPGDVPAAVKTATSIWSAFKGGKYREAIAGCILMVLFLWRRFASKFIIGKLSTWQVGFVAVLLGFLGTIPEALAMEPWNWITFLWAGIATSGEAMLFWKVLGQKVLPKVFGEVKEPV